MSIESESTEYSDMIQSLYHINFSPPINKDDMYKDIIDSSTSGTESVYDLAFVPISNSLHVYINGVYQSQYTLNGNTIDFNEVIPQGYRIVAWYIKEV